MIENMWFLNRPKLKLENIYIDLMSTIFILFFLQFINFYNDYKSIIA